MKLTYERTWDAEPGYQVFVVFEGEREVGYFSRELAGEGWAADGDLEDRYGENVANGHTRIRSAMKELNEIHLNP